MYRVYHLTDKEKDKIVKIRWDGDTHYYDVFETRKSMLRNKSDWMKLMQNMRKTKNII